MSIVQDRAVGATPADARVRHVPAASVVVHPVPENALQLELLHPRLGALHHLASSESEEREILYESCADGRHLVCCQSPVFMPAEWEPLPGES